MPGIYDVLKSPDVTVGPILERDSDKQRMLDEGDCVHVVEVRLLPEEQRIRGRLSDGGWISMKNTESGYMWVRMNKPHDLCIMWSNA